MKNLININRNARGFSLIELLTVLGIMAILTLIGNAAYNGYRDNASRAVAATTARNIASAYKACRATGGGCSSWEGIQMDGFQGKDGNPKSGNDSVCFQTLQATGTEEIKTCVSINRETDQVSYTIGWFDGNPLNNQNKQKLCFCASATQTDLILQGSEVKCNSPADCSGVGVSTCPDVDANTSRTKQCLGQMGQCQADGTCI